MSFKVLELRPERSLLNPNFDGYKLCLDQIEVIWRELPTTVNRCLPDINQYSSLHARLFGLFNHLTGDNAGIECVYFVDKSFKVQKWYIDPLSLNELCIVEVWQIPVVRDRQLGDFNVSLKFVSKKIAVLADGMGTLYVVDTKERNNDDYWVCLYSGEILNSNEKFIIMDAAYELNPEQNSEKLHLLVNSLNRESNERYSSLLHWITLSKVGNSWGEVALRELKSKGSIHYSYFEKGNEALYVISDEGCKFTLDSENPVVENKIENEKKVIKYTWSQNREDVTINFKLQNAETSNIIVQTASGQITIKHKDDILLNGELSGKIDSDLTIWMLENNLLQVTLSKKDDFTLWSELVIGDHFGEYIMDPSLVVEANERLAQFCSGNEIFPQSGTTFNSQEIEECDFEEDKCSIFERIDCITHSVTHRATLGCNQISLIVSLSEDTTAAVGVRHDVDVCVWQPQGKGEDFSIKHEGTLNAFGYIQASKQQRKFSVSPPDLSYAAVCESNRHLFIYRQNKPVTSGELRNRTTGAQVRNIAQQQVVTLPNDEVLGIYAFNTVLYILTEHLILGMTI